VLLDKQKGLFTIISVKKKKKEKEKKKKSGRKSAGAKIVFKPRCTRRKDSRFLFWPRRAHKSHDVRAVILRKPATALLYSWYFL
jgi:hypothetical protein